jgi:hypothetical protein
MFCYVLDLRVDRNMAPKSKYMKGPCSEQSILQRGPKTPQLPSRREKQNGVTFDLSNKFYGEEEKRTYNIQGVLKALHQQDKTTPPEPRPKKRIT